MGKLWAKENKGKEKEAQPSLCEESFWEAQKETGPGCLGTARTLGSSGNAERDQLGLGHLKWACSWTQGTKIGMSHQPPMVQKKG